MKEKNTNFSLFFIAFAILALCTTLWPFNYSLGAPPGTPYTPGETITPSCSPGSANCTVMTPATSGANSDITSLTGLTTPLSIGQGGTGLSNTPDYGKIPVGNGSGGYTLTATSSLGLSAGSATPAGSSGQLQYNSSGSLGADSGLSYSSVAQRLTTIYASTTALTGSYVSSTNLFAGSFTLGSLTGFLKATAGAISTALIDLANDITGILPIANGGTNVSTAPSYGQILVGNSGGGYTLTATSSLGINGGLGIAGSDTQVQFNNSGSLGANSGLTYNSGAQRLAATYVSSTGQSSSYVSSTNLIAGSFNLGSITGFLKATAGAVSNALIDLASDITGILPIANGGTGLTSAPSYGQLLMGNSSGGYTLTATSSLGLSTLSIGGSDTQVQFNNSGNLSGNSGLTYTSTANRLTATYVSSTGISGSYVSSTSLTSGSFTLGSLTGFLKATAGVISTALVDLTSNVTGILPVANGGSGTSTAFTAGSVVFADSNNKYSQSNSSFFWDNTNKRLGIGTASPGTAFEVSGTATASHIKGGGSTPSISAGVGAGTGGIALISGTDTAGQITVTAGVLPTAAATIATVTFATAYSGIPYVQITPANSTAAALSGNAQVYPTALTTTFVLTPGTTALSNASVYKWNYLIVE